MTAQGGKYDGMTHEQIAVSMLSEQSAEQAARIVELEAKLKIATDDLAAIRARAEASGDRVTLGLVRLEESAQDRERREGIKP